MWANGLSVPAELFEELVRRRLAGMRLSMLTTEKSCAAAVLDLIRSGGCSLREPQSQMTSAPLSRCGRQVPLLRPILGDLPRAKRRVSTRFYQDFCFPAVETRLRTAPGTYKLCPGGEFDL